MTDRRLTLPSYAKINWFLKVGGMRDDGFHEICTAFQTVSLHDTISFELSDEIRVSSDDPHLPTTEANLMYKAARGLKDLTGWGAGASLHISKRIPYPGGLGGGSSNAAVTLIGLCKLWGVHPEKEKLEDLAIALGSDIPFFFCGGTALGTGRGERLEPLRDVSPARLVIAHPSVRISTPEAFKALGRDRLTRESSKTTLIVCRKSAERLISGSVELENDFEEVAFRIAPKTREIRDRMIDLGAVSARLSGSGASVFGIFDNDSLRQTAIDRLSKESGTRVFAAETISRASYVRSMGPCGELLPSYFS